MIVLTGSTPLLSDAWLRRLKVGGRLFAITGVAPVMLAQLITCTAPGATRSVTLFETCVAPLVNAPQPAALRILRLVMRQFRPAELAALYQAGHTPAAARCARTLGVATCAAFPARS